MTDVQVLATNLINWLKIDCAISSVALVANKALLLLLYSVFSLQFIANNSCTGL